jgi:dipeptidyl-peptidase-3
MFNGYSQVPEEMLELREVVLARKEPRKLLVQPNMVLTATGVELRTYNASAEGMVASWVDRFRDDLPELFALVEGSQEENGFVDDMN